MRQSRYNIMVSGLDGEHLLFNSATGAFAVLDEQGLGALEHCQEALCPELARAGFLTALESSDELALQQQDFTAASKRHDTLGLCLAPTYACNFRCAYCYEHELTSRGGRMPFEVTESIRRLTAELHRRWGFGALFIEWYGGDPSLALDTVDDLSGFFLDFCSARGIAYNALMITNGNLIDGAAADLLGRCGIREVLITIDGPQELHDRRRFPADGSGSYQRIMHAIELLQERGITVNANMNADKVNWKTYPGLRDELMSRYGVALSTSQLNDYGGTFGQKPFAAPDYDLFTHEEYAIARHERFAADGFAAQSLRDLLRPTPAFCRGQEESYLVIDYAGDIYGCDGWMGDGSHRLGNIVQEIDALEAGGDPSWLHSITFDATADATCSACRLLPICQGSCIWERRLTGMPCHPLKVTLADYLRDYRSCFGPTTGPVTVLAEPLTAAEVASRQ